MTWLDMVCFVAFVGFMALAHKRGVILEVADILCILLGGTLAFRSFRAISTALHNSVFSGFSLNFLQKSCVFGVFTVAFLVIFAIALSFQRRVKEEKVLDKDVDQRLGLVVGFFKTTLLLSLCVAMLFYNDAFPERELKSLKGGLVVSRLLGLSTAVKPIVYIAAPQDLAKEFMDKGFSTSTKKAKKPKKKKEKVEKDV
jgi:uncharacterized membrane protein required for colicin V production